MLALLFLRLTFYIVMLVLFGFAVFFLWKYVCRPIIFEESIDTKLTDASEDFVDSETDKKAKNIRDKGRPY